jgi:hypothetical protein
MIIQCPLCSKHLGEKQPLNRKFVSHKLCDDCKENSLEPTWNCCNFVLQLSEKCPKCGGRYNDKG